MLKFPILPSERHNFIVFSLRFLADTELHRGIFVHIASLFFLLFIWDCLCLFWSISASSVHQSNFLHLFLLRPSMQSVMWSSSVNMFWNKNLLAPRHFGLSLLALRTRNRGSQGVRYNVSWLYTSQLFPERHINWKKAGRAKRRGWIQCRFSDRRIWR